MSNPCLSIAFNTGRGYSREGQRIVAKTLSVEDESGMLPEYKVAFADLDRGIYGRATLFGAFDQRTLMAAYDAGQYEGTWTNCDFHDAHEYFRELTAQNS